MEIDSTAVIDYLYLIFLYAYKVGKICPAVHVCVSK